MQDIEDFVAEGVESLGAINRSPYGQVYLWILEALSATGERHSASFWALQIVIGARRQETLRHSRLRQGDRWIRVSSSLLPKGADLDPRTKRAAIDLLERARVVEVRRFGHASPHIRFLRKPRAKKSASIQLVPVEGAEK